MKVHRNTPVRMAASLAALVAVLTSFKLLPKDQAEAVVGLIAVVGTVWHPRHQPKPRRAK